MTCLLMTGTEWVMALCVAVQRLTGDLFLFMDLCGVLLSNLRP